MDENSYGRAFEAESFPERVFDITLIRKMHKVGGIDKKNERRRANPVLHAVINLEPFPVFRRRLVRADRVRNYVVERTRGDTLAGVRVNFFAKTENFVRSLPVFR